MSAPDPFAGASSIGDDLPDDASPVLARAKFSRNDLGNARRLDSVLAGDAYYVPGVGWAVWDGARFVMKHGDILIRKTAQGLENLITEEAVVIRDGPLPLDLIDAYRMEYPKKSKGMEDEEIRAELAAERAGKHFGWAVQSGNNAKINAAVEAMTTLRTRDVRSFDRHAMRFTVENGALDLSLSMPIVEGEVEEERATRLAAMLVDHDQGDLATKAGGVTFDPAADCPRWRHIMQGMFPDIEDQLYLQRFCGYLLRGDNHKQVFAFLLGRGGNGKSTVMKMVGEVLGDAMTNVREDAFIETRGGGGEGPNPSEVEWVGCRVYFADEIKKGARLNAALLNGITGGNPRQSRQLREAVFTWDPFGVPVLNVNKLPPLGDDSEALLRRAMIFHWPHKLVDLAPEYQMTEDAVAAMVRDEAPGFLNWMLDGYAMFTALDDEGREVGFAPPASARDKMAVLRADSDPVGDFLHVCTQRVKTGRIRNVDLYRAYEAWADDAGVNAGKASTFAKGMADRDYTAHRSNGKQWLGIDWIDPKTAEERGFDDPERHASWADNLQHKRDDS